MKFTMNYESFMVISLMFLILLVWVLHDEFKQNKNYIFKNKGFYLGVIYIFFTFEAGYPLLYKILSTPESILVGIIHNYFFIYLSDLISTYKTFKDKPFFNFLLKTACVGIVFFLTFLIETYIR